MSLNRVQKVSDELASVYMRKDIIILARYTIQKELQAIDVASTDETSCRQLGTQHNTEGTPGMSDTAVYLQADSAPKEMAGAVCHGRPSDSAKIPAKRVLHHLEGKRASAMFTFFIFFAEAIFVF